MVPDDPLGRGGPHLDDFLRSEHRYKHPHIYYFISKKLYHVVSSELFLYFPSGLLTQETTLLPA